MCVYMSTIGPGEGPFLCQGRMNSITCFYVRKRLIQLPVFILSYVLESPIVKLYLGVYKNNTTCHIAKNIFHWFETQGIVLME